VYVICQTVHVYWLHINSVLLSDCLTVKVRIFPKSWRCF